MKRQQRASCVWASFARGHNVNEGEGQELRLGGKRGAEQVSFHEPGTQERHLGCQGHIQLS